MKTTDLEILRIGQRVTMRHPSGILKEATLIGNDDGIFDFQFWGFLRESVDPLPLGDHRGRPNTHDCSFPVSIERKADDGSSPNSFA